MCAVETEVDTLMAVAVEAPCPPWQHLSLVNSSGRLNYVQTHVVFSCLISYLKLLYISDMVRCR